MSIRILQEQDVAIAAELSAEAGWNQTPDDWRMLLRLNPEGCFGIDCDGRLVSTATLVCYGARLAWIGMVLTNGPYQRRGFARTLLLHAIQRADELSVQTLKLDATDQGRPLYESLGFRVEQPVERWGRAAAREAPLRPARLTEASMELDLAAHGADRSLLLQSLADRSRVYASADGFCLARIGRKANYVGPCVSQSAEEACDFLEACAGAESSYWDLLPENQPALRIATSLGFTPLRKLVRMVRGRDLRGRENWIYAIAGFELG